MTNEYISCDEFRFKIIIIRKDTSTQYYFRQIISLEDIRSLVPEMIDNEEFKSLIVKRYPYPIREPKIIHIFPTRYIPKRKLLNIKDIEVRDICPYVIRVNPSNINFNVDCLGPFPKD